MLLHIMGNLMYNADKCSYAKESVGIYSRTIKNGVVIPAF